MYQGLKNELIRIITNPKFQLKHLFPVIDGQRCETYALYNGDAQIVALTKGTIVTYLSDIDPETGGTYTWQAPNKYYYLLTLNQTNNYTPNVEDSGEIKKLYELCEKRQKFYKVQANIAAMDFLTRQR